MIDAQIESIIPNFKNILKESKKYNDSFEVPDPEIKER